MLTCRSAATAAVAGVTALAAYANAKLHLGKDIDAIRRMKRGERDYAKALEENRICPYYPFLKSVQDFPNQQILWSRETCYTYTEAHDEVARYAQWLLEQGIRPGELVAMYLINSPEFLLIWMAMMAIGCAPAFINYNLEGNALIHCLKVCETKIILCDDDAACRKRIEGSRSEIENLGPRIVFLDQNTRSQIAAHSSVIPDDSYRENVKGEFPFCLIYTSGTTGLPKGCAFTIERLRMIAPHVEPSFNGVKGVSRWYNCMPLYHGTGAISSLSCFMGAVSVAVARRFSVTNFWKDVHDSGSTHFIYVGETARYLLNAPPGPYDRDHKLQCAYGNGMRPDVWEKFQKRFNIPEVAEFFNSSEGMFVLLNYSRSPYFTACVGHHGIIFRYLLRNVYVPVQIDFETGDIWRDPKTGFAKRTTYDEGGEMLVAIPNEQAFQGYWNSETATKKKFVKDLFKKGDLYYRSGDALRRDNEGRWYFLDRLGDTFRWKSENVSTAEVAIVLGQYPGVAEANVYGVLVPGHDGRAGCAALHLESGTDRDRFDYNGLLAYARKRLPKYAVPVFIRQVAASQHIHNNKQNKVPLRNEGVDPRKAGTLGPSGKDDKFLWVPPRADAYEPFGDVEWKSLEAGQARL